MCGKYATYKWEKIVISINCKFIDIFMFAELLSNAPVISGRCRGDLQAAE